MGRRKEGSSTATNSWTHCGIQAIFILSSSSCFIHTIIAARTIQLNTKINTQIHQLKRAKYSYGLL